jgi:hypothetical protein
MTEFNKPAKDTSREDDYRDYEERDITSGWPYADSDVKKADANKPYGGSGGNFDEPRNTGFQRASDTEIRSSGGPEISSSATHDEIDDDEIAERVNAVLEDTDDVDPDLVAIVVHQGIATLTGRVETALVRQRLERQVEKVSGVRECVNELVTIGIGSHIPDDAADG